jgi:hypothetical protein
LRHSLDAGGRDGVRPKLLLDDAGRRQRPVADEDLTNVIAMAVTASEKKISRSTARSSCSL